MLLSPVLRQRYLDANGNPLAGGKLYSYAAGTSTPKTTYSDSGGATNANPVVLDANGEANLWLDVAQSYKFILKDSADVQQWSVDNVTVGGPFGTASISDSAITTAKIADANVTTAKIADGSVTRQKLVAMPTGTTVAAGGLAIAAPSTTSTSSSTKSDVSGQSVTITTTGRPVLILCVPDLDASPGLSTGSLLMNSTAQSGGGNVWIYRDGVAISVVGLSASATGATGCSAAIPVGAINTIDVPEAGAHTYKLVWRSGFDTSILMAFEKVKLVAVEL